MFELILSNADGDKINFSQNSAFTVTEIEGLNPPDSTINTSAVALMDGGKYVSSKMEMRTLRIAFAIEYDASKQRIELYKVLRAKQWINVEYIGKYRQVYIEGYIEKIDIDYFRMKQIVTVQILCPDPYFKSAQEMIDELSTVVSDFYFPFSSTATPQIVFSHIASSPIVTIRNNGDADCGMIIDLFANDAVADPTIYNYITQEFIGIKYNMQALDLIRIDTRKGKLSAKLIRNGVESNIFQYVIKDSTWLQLPASGGTFTYTVGSGSNASDLMVTFSHFNIFEGV